VFLRWRERAGSRQVVGVVGATFRRSFKKLAARGVDLAGWNGNRAKNRSLEARYSYDLNSRERSRPASVSSPTFNPHPPKIRDAEYVFLGNIDRSAAHVLDQVKKPKLVACDTMNYWIQGRRICCSSCCAISTS